MRFNFCYFLAYMHLVRHSEKQLLGFTDGVKRLLQSSSGFHQELEAQMEAIVCFRHGLSADTVEKLLHIGLACALSQMVQQGGLTHEKQLEIAADTASNMTRVQELDPTSPWVCTYAARYQWTAKRDTFEAMQVLFSAIKSKTPMHLLRVPSKRDLCALTAHQMMHASSEPFDSSTQVLITTGDSPGRAPIH